MTKYEVSRSDSYDLFLDQFDPQTFKNPEENLLSAVLEKACKDLFCKENAKVDVEPSFRIVKGKAHQYQKRRHKDDPPSITIGEETEEWFLDDAMDPFSFLWICQHLNLDALTIRNHMLELKKSLA